MKIRLRLTGQISRLSMEQQRPRNETVVLTLFSVALRYAYFDWFSRVPINGSRSVPKSAFACVVRLTIGKAT